MAYIFLFLFKTCFTRCSWFRNTVTMRVNFNIYILIRFHVLSDSADYFAIKNYWNAGAETSGAGAAPQAGGEEQESRAGEAQQGEDGRTGEHTGVSLTDDEYLVSEILSSVPPKSTSEYTRCCILSHIHQTRFCHPFQNYCCDHI